MSQHIESLDLLLNQYLNENRRRDFFDIGEQLNDVRNDAGLSLLNLEGMWGDLWGHQEATSNGFTVKKDDWNPYG